MPHAPNLEERLKKVEAAIERRDEPMTMTDREIDAKFEAAEARTDTKIARLEGKLDLTIQKIDQLSTNFRDAIGGMNASIAAVQSQARSNLQIMISVVVAGMLAIFFGLFAVMQWSDARMFGMVQLRESVKTAGTESPAATPAKPSVETPKPPATPQ